MTPKNIEKQTERLREVDEGTTSNGPHAARLREEIDRGGSGDKVAFVDPAAAPLGTDDEAAGTTPSSEQVATAMDHEATRSTAAARKPGPTERHAAKSDMRKWMLVSVLVALAVSGIALVAGL